MCHICGLCYLRGHLCRLVLNTSTSLWFHMEKSLYTFTQNDVVLLLILVLSATGQRFVINIDNLCKITIIIVFELVRISKCVYWPNTEVWYMLDSRVELCMILMTVVITIFGVALQNIQWNIHWNMHISVVLLGFVGLSLLGCFFSSVVEGVGGWWFCFGLLLFFVFL